MNAAEVIAEIEQAGGEIWTEGDKLKFRDTPAHLIPAIREHKAEIITLLAAESSPTVESYPSTTTAATVQQRARKGPSRASDAPVQETAPNGVSCLTPPQVRCPECNSVASTSSQEAGVRYCNITRSHFDVDHHALIWGHQSRTCSRFVARVPSVSEGVS